MSIGWRGMGNMLFDKLLMRRGRVDLGTGANKRYSDFYGNVVVPRTPVDPSVRGWLRGALPSLDAYDLKAYALGLLNISFHPSCPSQCELRYDDLDFMGGTGGMTATTVAP